MKPFRVICRDCRTDYSLSLRRRGCPGCGSNWLEASYDYAALKRVAADWQTAVSTRPSSLWRYHELLPLHHQQNRVSLGEGWTPLLKAENVGLMLGHPHIYIKDERQGPTGSFKDRQAAIAVSVMKEMGVKEAVAASTGNVAIAYSAYCARAGIKLWVFVTSSVPSEKMREVALYGSEVIKVAGTYGQAKQVAADFAAGKNLFLDRGVKDFAAVEAMKTLAFEIAEQLGQKTGDGAWGDGRWHTPDWYVQAVSGGMGPVGVIKGFQELNRLGLASGQPKLACVQVNGCAPMADSFAQGLETAVPIENPMTDITTLATGDPGRAYCILRENIQENGGAMLSVTDGEAFRALQVLAQMDGISVEPATAVAFAGLFKLIQDGMIRPEETVVVNCSGHTFPVEKHILGDHFARDMVLPDMTLADEAPVGETPRPEGLLTALEDVDSRVHRIAILEDT
ncbi:MAG: pyridoxal-phosphate dependent enzyme, partial [Anaerolineae bacterium]